MMQDHGNVSWKVVVHDSSKSAVLSAAIRGNHHGDSEPALQVYALWERLHAGKGRVEGRLQRRLRVFGAAEIGRARWIAQQVPGRGCFVNAWGARENQSTHSDAADGPQVARLAARISEERHATKFRLAILGVDGDTAAAQREGCGEGERSTTV